jgi:hypothetical protein
LSNRRQLWRYVLLLHGVQSNGDWYAHATTVLAPHLVVARPTYRGYSSPGVGLAATFIEPWGALTGAIGAGAALASGAYGVSAVAALAAGLLTRRFRRNRALETVRIAIGNAQAPNASAEPERSPHIFAHSWGTYLAWHALASDGTLKAGVVIFVGTPLARATPWRRVRARVQAVHNMVARDDGLTRALDHALETPWVNGPARFVAPPLVGGAGHRGFAPNPDDIDPGDVHSVATGEPPHESWRCPPCATRWAWLHNWFSTAYHSEFLVRRDRLAYVVRPLLWGIPPASYQELLSHCERVDLGQFFRERPPLGGYGPLNDLLNTPRRFFDGRPLSLELLLQLGGHDRRLDPDGSREERLEELGLAFAARVRNAIARDMGAWEEAQQSIRKGSWAEPGLPDPSDQRYPLHPSRAIEELVGEVRRGEL